MSDILQELLVLAGIPVTEAEETTVLPNENSLGKRIALRNNQSALKNFWNWFADSKIKDAQGRPLVLYHGTDYSFEQFEMTGEVEFPSAAYFTSKKTLAKTYGSFAIAVYIKMSNPYVINAKGKTFNDFYEQMAEDMHYAKDNGFDGVIIRNFRDDWGQNNKRGILADTYAVFDSRQIKSVENSGYYDANSKNIYEAETPTPQFPNLNLNREKIIPDNDPVKLKNFRNWFGNSTAGWNGQPMVFYHGTQSQRQGNKQAGFNSFDKTKLGKHSHFSSKVGFFFTSSKMVAEKFGSHVIPVYLRMIKPKIYSSGAVSSIYTKLEEEFYNTHKNIDEYVARAPLEAMRAHTDAYDKFVADIYHRNGMMPFVQNTHNSFEDAVDIRGKEDEFIAKYIASLKSEGYDSIVIRDTVADASKNFGEPTTQYCVFDPEQIKSVDNNGEFSPASSNIYESIEYAHMESDGVMFQILKNPSYDEFWELLIKSNAQRLRSLVYNGSNEKLCFVWDAFYGTTHYLTLKTYLRKYDQNIKHWAQVYCDEDSYEIYGNCPDWFLETYYPNLAKTGSGRQKEIEEAVAYAASRRDYDAPSLDAIGSGEGYQAHGWGLYYALKPSTAEDYRTFFAKNPREHIFEINGEDLTEFLGELLNNETEDLFYNVFGEESSVDTSKLKDSLLQSLYDVWYFYSSRYKRSQNMRDKELAEEALEKRDYVGTMGRHDFDVGQGIIHKVELPDIKFLMGEKELIRDQSDYVKLRVASIVKDMIPDLKLAYFAISGKEFYGILTDKLGSPKKASLLLHKYGIKGIHYVGREDGECVVIFNPDDLRVLKKFYGGNGIEMEKLDG